MLVRFEERGRSSQSGLQTMKFSSPGLCPGARKLAPENEAMTAIQVFTISEGDLFDWVRSFLIGAITFTVITEWQTNENYDVPPNTAGA